ncbi:hypothetical protein RRG08_039132 [Elysia crispata]|uniref:Uncharacterized protein n=1 Tax=Elysia crispata TaxID=231223 RepID=A0AAE0YMC7_9GAST|nr:hypothetical protein RRG08_039132 [Elysia crispata]
MFLQISPTHVLLINLLKPESRKLRKHLLVRDSPEGKAVEIKKRVAPLTTPVIDHWTPSVILPASSAISISRGRFTKTLINKAKPREDISLKAPLLNSFKIHLKKKKNAPDDTTPLHTTPDNTIKHQTTPHRFTPHQTTPYSTRRHHTASHHTRQHHKAPDDTTPLHTTPDNTIKHQTTPHRFTPHQTTPYSTK